MKERSVSRRSRRRRRRRFFCEDVFGNFGDIWATTTDVTEASSGGRIREARSGRLECAARRTLWVILGASSAWVAANASSTVAKTSVLRNMVVFGVSCVRTARSTNERVVRDRVEELASSRRAEFHSLLEFLSLSVGESRARSRGGAPSAPHSRSRATTTKGMSAGAFLPFMVV